MIRALVVLSYDLPNVEAITDVLDAIDPPATPHFANVARVVPDPASVAAVLKYLDDDEGPIASAAVVEVGRFLTVASPANLAELLDNRLNQHGHIPESVAYDADRRPLLVWLDEEGGDSVVLRSAYLGGESAEVSEPLPEFPDELKWPLVAILPDVQP